MGIEEQFNYCLKVSGLFWFIGWVVFLLQCYINMEKKDNPYYLPIVKKIIYPIILMMAFAGIVPLVAFVFKVLL